ncbi:MAG TPA: hypothetical protein VFD22_07875 [Gemmatimonadaceae bacterium]|jgi:hypothetical protein|nr:hypothetical protein [Gemmatimonadaceae bacterium]
MVLYAETRVSDESAELGEDEVFLSGRVVVAIVMICLGRVRL